MNSRESPKKDLGFSDCMGEELRTFVENQLVEDLSHYYEGADNFGREDVVFDWSDSCIEGHRTTYLDGEVENFSGVEIFDTSNNWITGGWMEFIETENSLVVFWWFLGAGVKYSIREKSKNGIPHHVWEKIDTEAKSRWKKFSPFAH